MAIAGSVPVSGFVAPTDQTDTYPSHAAEYGKGGMRSVADLTDRDAIPTARREEGMLVFVIDTNTMYQLKGGISNTDWVLSEANADFEESIANLANLVFINTTKIAKIKIEGIN